MTNREFDNPEQWPAWLVAQRAAFEGVGLDIVAPLSTGAWARAQAERPGIGRIDSHGRADAIALVVGNTRAAWPRWLDAIAARPDLRDSADPIDRCTDAWLAEVVATSPVAATVHPAWRVGDGAVSMLRAAELAGLAHVGPAHLAVHPAHGPWFAIRAVVTYDAPWSLPAPPPAPDPCTGCSAPCVDAMRAATPDGSAPTAAGVADRWRAWVAVRDACPVGRPARYDDAQVRYHYTRDAGVLAEAIAHRSTAAHDPS